MLKLKTIQRMKKVFVFLLLLTLATTHVTGQKDTSKIKIDLLFGRLPADSLMRHEIRIQSTSRYFRYDAVIANYSTKPAGYHNRKTPARPDAPSGMTGNVTKFSRSQFIIPAILISYGLIAQKSTMLRALDKNTHYEMTRHFQGRFRIDDYMQFAPYAAYYALDMAEWKARHNARDRTIVLITSLAIMTGTVTAIKNDSGVERPDRSSRTSFPSGHTATAFLGAHLLFHEYKDVSPWIGIAGYASATTVACLRVRNRRHWVSDVVAGAGIGILSAEAGRLLLPVFYNIAGMNSRTKNLLIAPAASVDSYGVGLAYSF
jgi:membrane-associated phospholipid phosphatase